METRQWSLHIITNLFWGQVMKKLSLVPCSLSIFGIMNRCPLLIFVLSRFSLVLVFADIMFILKTTGNMLKHICVESNFFHVPLPPRVCVPTFIVLSCSCPMFVSVSLLGMVGLGFDDMMYNHNTQYRAIPSWPF